MHPTLEYVTLLSIYLIIVFGSAFIIFTILFTILMLMDIL